MHRQFFIVLSVVAACVAVACGTTPGKETPVTADTWAVVDGHAIMRDDVEKAYRRATDNTAPLSEEENLTTRLGLIDELIIQEILISRARDSKIEVTDSELDTAYAERRKNLSDEAFQQELTRRNLTSADMRQGL